MRQTVLAAIIAAACTVTASAEFPALKPELTPIGFLVGAWKSGTGIVADTGGTSRGSSTITSEVDGSVLLRRDHTDLFSPDGKPRGSFDQIMMIYSENATLHADYSDGVHVIHYTSARIEPGRSVVFSTAMSQSTPAYRLRYELTDAHTLAVRFEVAPPGQTAFHAIATGTLSSQ